MLERIVEIASLEASSVITPDDGCFSWISMMKLINLCFVRIILSSRMYDRIIPTYIQFFFLIGLPTILFFKSDFIYQDRAFPALEGMFKTDRKDINVTPILHVLKLLQWNHNFLPLSRYTLA